MGLFSEPIKEESLYDQFIKKFGPEVKAREGNNIRQICPECKHNSLSANIHNGCFFCFNCGYGKGLKLYGVQGGQPETPVDNDLHKKVTNFIFDNGSLLGIHKKYLVERSIYGPERYKFVTSSFALIHELKRKFSNEDLVASGYFSLWGKDLKASRALDPRRILIPYWSGEEILTLKSRANPFADQSEEVVRYLAPRGSSLKDKLWYKGSLRSNSIITEGELAAIAAHSLGYSVCAVPGLGFAKSPAIQTALKSLIKDVKRLYIILDTDPGIQDEALRLQNSIKLFEVAPDISSILYLPQDKEDECMDLDLYLSRYGSDELDYLLDTAWARRGKTYDELRKRAYQ